MNNITLQINVSPGDLAYVRMTVPALLSAHLSCAAERLIVLDASRGQRTRIFDPARRGSREVFLKNVGLLTDIANDWLANGLIDRLEILHEGDPIIDKISKRWFRGLITETHDYGGCALMSYMAAVDWCRTRYLLHYDADMVLHQDPRFDWAEHARSLMIEQPNSIAARPRISPPFADIGDPSDAPSLHEALPLRAIPGGWRNDWFTTRCFLIDCEKLRTLSPILTRTQKVWFQLRKIMDRGYPPSPEVMLYRHLPRNGFYCLNLASRKAWLLHPRSKPAAYIALLSKIIPAVRTGGFPDAQRGRADIQLTAWEEMLIDGGVTV